MTISRRNFMRGLGAGAIAVPAAAMSAHAGWKISDMPMTQDGKFLLPKLDYAYDALEPHIDKQTMMLHHDIHHQGYVNGLNTAMTRLAEIRDTGDTSLVKHWSRELAFHGSGHFLHSIFWKNMSPKGGGAPNGSLATMINRDFGSFDKFKTHFSAASKSVEGVGWGILGYHPVAQKLFILQAEKHQNLTAQGVIPILVVDVWEHAYYLKYQNKRGDYVGAFFNVINWDDVATRLNAAMK